MRIVFVLAVCSCLQYVYSCDDNTNRIDGVFDARRMVYSGQIERAVQYCSGINYFDKKDVAIVWTVYQCVQSPCLQRTLLDKLCNACDNSDKIIGKNLVESQRNESGGLVQGYDTNTVIDGLRMLNWRIDELDKPDVLRNQLMQAGFTPMLKFK